MLKELEDNDYISILTIKKYTERFRYIKFNISEYDDTYQYDIFYDLIDYEKYQNDALIMASVLS